MGKPLHGPYEGLHTARRGTYRVIYKIDEGEHTIEIRTIRHRADAYQSNRDVGRLVRHPAREFTRGPVSCSSAHEV